MSATIRSMTGFARAEGEADGVAWTWELKSVNGKSLDLRFRLPGGFDALELPLRTLVGERVKRGSVSVNLTIARTAAAANLQVNRAALEQVLALVGGLTAETYDATRRQLLQAWWDELRRAEKLYKLRQPLDRERLRKLASSFVLLHTQIDPNRLEMDSAVRKNALGELYDFVRAIETVQ